MLEQQPAHVHENSRDLNYQEHDTEDDGKVHERECLVKGHDGDNMMCHCLIIERGSALYQENYREKIHYEEACTCNYGPNMDVSDCVNALIAVKHGLVTRANVQETDRTQNDADARVENRDDRCSEIGLLLKVTIWVDCCLEAK